MEGVAARYSPGHQTILTLDGRGPCCPIYTIPMGSRSGINHMVQCRLYPQTDSAPVSSLMIDPERNF